MSIISGTAWKRAYEKNVEKSYAETYWPVYESNSYQLHGKEGFRYIRAAVTPGRHLSEAAKLIDPFASKYANLFLGFARWFDTHKMDKATKTHSKYIATLDTDRNAAAALEWGREYGVLGLGTNPNFSLAIGGHSPTSTEAAARRLGKPQLGRHGIRRQYRMSDEGGEHETVEMFVLEAHEANDVLKLYTAAAAKTFNRLEIERFMSSEERGIYAQDDDRARNWALGIVEEAVNRKVERNVYPILTREGESYKEGWGFKSLLGAMWFQMRMFILGDESYGQCLQCGEVFYRSRRGRDYCGTTCSNRASSAQAYERKKRRQEEARKATRRKLRRG